MQIAEREGEVAIKVLADKLKVSEMTIYRDVDVLQEQRYLYKKRGAIVYIENDDRATADFYADEKRAIGIKAADKKYLWWVIFCAFSFDFTFFW